MYNDRPFLNYVKFLGVLKEIEDNHSWKNMRITDTNYAHVKYIDFGVDTRNMDIWIITLRGLTSVINYNKSEKTFRIEKQDDLDKMFKFLRNEIDKI